MAAATASVLLSEHPTNPIHDTYHESTSNKEEWTQPYPPITRLNVRTQVQGNQTVIADFDDDDAFLPEYDDDELRYREPASRPNYRKWRLDSEEDGMNWFHAEISNVVLAAWARYPSLLQASREKPLSDAKGDEVVDVAYSVKHGRERVHVAIGEFKKGGINAREWQNGKLLKGQQGLSKELRGYADRYACPQVFCFDHTTLLLLQFRASTASQIRDEDCEVDCWVLPRENLLGTTLRYAFYRLLAQGFRRCQATWANGISLYGVKPHRREFYNGRPIWKIDGKKYQSPWGHCRKVDAGFGAFYWTDAGGFRALVDEGGEVVWDTAAFWGTEEE